MNTIQPDSSSYERCGEAKAQKDSNRKKDILDVRSLFVTLINSSQFVESNRFSPIVSSISERESRVKNLELVHSPFLNERTENHI